ncbi:Uncharacterised protein [Bordetella pertussis]|nr:Uncharacterised protein [Bordetella pertussis]
MMAPSARSRATTCASRSALAWFAYCCEPMVVRMPATSIKSLTATGMPCSAPAGAPPAKAASASAACRMTVSGSTLMKLFSGEAAIRSSRSRRVAEGVVWRVR